MTLLVVAAFVVAVIAAARSTWSPCGLSMLSSITPLGERGRGHAFGSTAGWFVAGAVLGGATLGGVMAGLAALVAAAGPSHQLLLIIAAVAAAAGAAVDLGLTGITIPLLRRQVNEVWLDRFRNWVYGGGFGWQIGVGFTTYVMTAAVVLTVALGVLTGSPLVAFTVGLAFGTFRGLTVLLGRRVTDPERLRAAHRLLGRLRRPVWRTVVGSQLVASAVLAAVVWPPAIALAALVAAIAGARHMRRRPVAALGIPDNGVAAG